MIKLGQLVALLTFVVTANLPSSAHAIEPALIEVSRVSFCEASSEPYVKDALIDCSLETVELPHSWTPVRDGLSVGIYRLEVPRPKPGAYGLILNRLALDGRVKVDGRIIIDHIDTERPSRWRYWPLVGQFNVDEDRRDLMVIDIAARAHSELKNGLGGVKIGPLAEIEAEYRSRLEVEVLLIGALAFAAIFAGIIGLSIGDQRNTTSRILVITSWLSIVGGLRCLHNLVIDLPLPILVWQRLGLWLLALAGILAIQVVATYLKSDRPTRTPLFTSIAVVTLLFVTPASVFDSKIIINLIFTTITLVAAAFLIRLITHLRKRSDPVGIAILSVFAVALTTGAHDLFVHLGSATLSDQYLQTWTLPAALALAVAALVKRASDQREIERQLQQATVRREEMLRDLHDRIGSRLVALSFHAQQVSQDDALVNEIKSLIQEVRLIHGAVAAEATSLDSLLADFRHLYSRIGGGRLPINWEISELTKPLRLEADQAIAVLRIVEEAIANIIKHANAERITFRLMGSDKHSLATLDIIDNGTGDFRPGESGGLENMRLRAARAGLVLELLRLDDGKTVRIRFPKARSKP